MNTTRKRSLVLCLLLSSLTVMTTRAQGFHLGVKAGANIFKIDGQSFETNYRTGSQFSTVYTGGPNDFKGKLNYLSVPILLSFRPVKFISLLVGPQFGILMSGDQTLVQNGQNAFKKGDFSMVGGAQLNLAAFKLGARYVIGLNDVNDLGNGNATNSETWKNQGFQVYAGFRIF
jgi:hypothetical protein